MARPRQAKQREVEAVVQERISKLPHALSTPAAIEIIKQLPRGNDYLETHSAEEIRNTLRELCALGNTGIAEHCRILLPVPSRLRKKDPSTIARLLDALIGAPSGEAIVPDRELTYALCEMVARWIAPGFVYKTIQPWFWKAYQLLKAAQVEGKAITIDKLAQECTHWHFNRNPRSAINNMRRALQEIAIEEQRCEMWDMPFPAPGSTLEVRPAPRENGL